MEYRPMNTHESYNSGKAVSIEGNSRNEILEPVEKLSGFVANILNDPKNFEATHTSFVTERQKRMGKEPTVRQYSINQEARSKAKEFVNSCKTLSEALNILEAIREQKASLDKNDPHYKQKIAIFRSLLGMAQMQLVDKIKSSLSPQEEEEFVRQINEISEKSKQAKNNSSDRNQTQEMGVHAFVRQKAREIIEKSKQPATEGTKEEQSRPPTEQAGQSQDMYPLAMYEEGHLVPLSVQVLPAETNKTIIGEQHPQLEAPVWHSDIIDQKQAPKNLREVNPDYIGKPDNAQVQTETTQVQDQKPKDAWQRLRRFGKRHRIKIGSVLATLGLVLSIRGSSVEPPKDAHTPTQDRGSVSQEMGNGNNVNDWMSDIDIGSTQIPTPSTQTTSTAIPVELTPTSAVTSNHLQDTEISQENNQIAETERKLENGMEMGNINLAELAYIEIPKEIFDDLGIKINQENLQENNIRYNLDVFPVDKPDLNTGGFPAEMDDKLSKPLEYPEFAAVTRTGVENNNIIWAHSFNDKKGNPFVFEWLRKLWKKYGTEAPNYNIAITLVDKNGNTQKVRLLRIARLNYDQEIGNQAARYQDRPETPPFFRLDGPLGKHIPQEEDILTLGLCDGHIDGQTRRIVPTHRILAVFEKANN